METCQYKKQHTAAGIGKTHKTICGKPGYANINNRCLCEHHYNHETAKQKRRNVRQMLERVGIAYGSFLKMLRRNPTHQHYQLFKHKL